MIKKEEGEKRTFSTGAHKQAAAGKGTPVLFPGDAYLEISKHFEEGASVHGARNWEKGIPLSKLIDSLERHIAQEKLGMTDESHARAIAWNAVVYLATKIRIERGQLPKELADILGIPEVESSETCGSCIFRNYTRYSVFCAGCFGVEGHPKWRVRNETK